MRACKPPVLLCSIRVLKTGLVAELRCLLSGRWWRLQATIMTDPGMADRTYIGPMTPEYAEQILAKVRQGSRGLG
jgi:hypothetical protein